VGPLAGLRVAVTMPPNSWFGGIDYNFAVEMADEMRAHGAAVFEVDVYPCWLRNQIYVDDAIAALRSVRRGSTFRLTFCSSCNMADYHETG
jgi:hypothetical protein